MRALVVGAVAALLALPLAAQPPAAETPIAVAGPVSLPESRAEEFDLDIGEKRITEEDFVASLAVEIAAGGQEGLHVRAGAVVTARRIELLLRGVTGHVRFFATLEPIRDAIERHRF